MAYKGPTAACNNRLLPLYSEQTRDPFSCVKDPEYLTDSSDMYYFVTAFAKWQHLWTGYLMYSAFE